jgi:hypothetical protein
MSIQCVLLCKCHVATVLSFATSSITEGPTTADAFPDLEGDPTNFPAPGSDILVTPDAAAATLPNPCSRTTCLSKESRRRERTPSAAVVVVVGSRGGRGGVFWSFLDEKMMMIG